MSVTLEALVVHKFTISASGIDPSHGCVWKAHLLHVCRRMTQAAGQGVGNRSRGLNPKLRPTVKFPPLFVYPPPTLSTPPPLGGFTAGLKQLQKQSFALDWTKQACPNSSKQRTICKLLVCLWRIIATMLKTNKGLRYLVIMWSLL